jgi:ribonuclease G
VKKEIKVLVNITLEEAKVAVLENGRLFDLFIERKESEKILNNIYSGKVQNIVPALGSAFIDIGFGRSAYLSVDDVVAHRGGKNIEDMIKIGQDIIVQVYKESIGTKGPKVTMNISIPGRLLVYMPFGGDICISRKIGDKQERRRLKNIVTELKKDVPGGIIVRTEAEEAEKAELKNEIKYLTRLWVSIVKRFNGADPANLIHRDLGIVFQTVRDYFSDEVVLMHIDSRKGFEDVVDFVKIVSPEFLDRIVLYKEKTPIFKSYGVEEEIKKLRANNIKLHSGGYIIIQEAESLCAVDVNSGKFTAGSTPEDTAVVTNLEASEEIARQLRLRNIGGIIVIDFIDMGKEANRQKVLDKLRAATKGDKAKIKIWPITKLGLIEMTRERKRESLFSLLGDTCPVCRGLGLVLSKESVFISICNEIEHLEFNGADNRVKIRLNPELVGYFKERKARVEELLGTGFDIEACGNMAREEYEVILV